MTYRSQFGQLGENIACRYLVDKNFKIIEKNYRQKWGEIDIIARAPDKTLVFVEVKTVRDVEKLHSLNDNQYFDGRISAENQLTATKLKKLQKTASLYAGNYPELVDNNKGWRIDLLALTIIGNRYVISHYENI